MDKSLISDYSWIKSGSQREKIVKILLKPMTPKEIQKETHLKFSNVSDCLKALKTREIVDILNPESHLGRLYELTDKGKKIQKEL